MTIIRKDAVPIANAEGRRVDGKDRRAADGRAVMRQGRHA
jgi:hypothetical protein